MTTNKTLLARVERTLQIMRAVDLESIRTGEGYDNIAAVRGLHTVDVVQLLEELFVAHLAAKELWEGT